jgi:hypothetical protein
MGLAWAGSGAAPRIDLVWIAIVGLAVMISLGYLAWQVTPAYIFSAAVVLSPLAGNWQALGIPGALSLDRLLLVVTIAVVLLRQVAAADGSRLRLEPVHWVLAAAVVYATASALAAGTFLNSGPFFRLFQVYGVLPFLVFVTAPLAFRTRRDREILLTALVALGAYLGLTALFESVGLNTLVFPKYITNPDYGIQFGRARGPFADAPTNGMALYVCAVASVIAFSLWRRPSKRAAAGVICVLCLLGTFLTMQRSVWLATVLATAVVMVTTRDLRRMLVPVLAIVVVTILGALVFIPGLASQSQQRVNQQRTLWDRENANRAALNMVDQRPLLGFGWGEFPNKGPNYFQLDSNYPLSETDVHNVLLGLAAELGLIGLTLWVAGLLLGVGTAMLARPPPELRPWHVGLVAIGTYFIVLINFVPPVVFPNLIIWLWAGVVWAGRVPAQRHQASVTE